jgi:NAD(P)-dependent dehydrogenase (short-subunit alcohol dehydrogenase family)
MFMRMNPLLDPAEAEEIAAAVAYLASDEARSFTGTALPIDGGQAANRLFALSPTGLSKLVSPV